MNTVIALLEIGKEKAAEIERLRAELTAAYERVHYAEGTADLAMQHRDAAEAKAATAFRAGVKAGMEAAAQWADSVGAEYELCLGIPPKCLVVPASEAIRAIDPTTVPPLSHENNDDRHAG